MKEHLQFFNWYSIAALRLKASIKAVSWSVIVFPTLLTSIPSVFIPTLNSEKVKRKSEYSLQNTKSESCFYFCYKYVAEIKTRFI